MRYRKRGRPPHEKGDKDLGTIELQEKRALGHTEELLDRYYRLGMISETQYWCGNHFRWLYVRRFGVPYVGAVDLGGGIASRGPDEDDEQWLERINLQYREAETALKGAHLLAVALDILVYSQCAHTQMRSGSVPDKLLEAFDILVDLWC